MKCYKEKEFIIFDFENGKTASYNMNTGETIGKQGKPVKSLCAALAGYEINDIINSFEDKKYREFLRYVRENFTPRQYNGYRCGYGSRVTNLGTLFNYASMYKIFEQYFVAGIKCNKYIRTPITEVPKGLLKICRQANIEIDDSLIRSYNEDPNMYTFIFSMELENINDYQKWEMASMLRSKCGWPSGKLIHELNYNLKALMKYIEYLCTFEGLTASSHLVREIGDYANMMSAISNKYEKYPKYFLSTHRIASRNYERLKRDFSEQLFAKRIKPEYEITHGDYKFIYPRCTQDIKDEAVQQNNCVASYIDKVINGDCDILFLRRIDAPQKSVVTIEVRNGKIVQAFQAYNQYCTEEQMRAVEAFNRKFSKERK